MNGNMLTNGNGVTYTWDSENRLLAVSPNAPAVGDKSLVHSYDALHRRVTTTVREWLISGWYNIQSTHFIYDGWNVIEEWNTSFTPQLIKTLTWGIDVSGSLQGAGGVGGLLMVEEINVLITTAYHFHYDGNGNVTQITDASGNNAASYRYDAFGNTLIATGAYAPINNYRFSTKPLNSEVSNAPLYYYGYRYYDPVNGRWPSRDPIEESGGLNLYGFVGNDGLNLIDVLGNQLANPVFPLPEPGDSLGPPVLPPIGQSYKYDCKCTLFFDCRPDDEWTDLSSIIECPNLGNISAGYGSYESGNKYFAYFSASIQASNNALANAQDFCGQCCRPNILHVHCVCELFEPIAKMIPVPEKPAPKKPATKNKK